MVWRLNLEQEQVGATLKTLSRRKKNSCNPKGFGDINTWQTVLSDAGEQVAAAYIADLLQGQLSPAKTAASGPTNVPWRECIAVYNLPFLSPPHKYGLMGRAIRIKSVLCSWHKLQSPNSRFSKIFWWVWFIFENMPLDWWGKTRTLKQ